MTPHGLLAVTCPGRVRPMLLRTCVATLLIWLVIYMITDSTVDSNPQTWSFSKLLQSAAERFNFIGKQPSVQREQKLVLLWTDYFSKKDWLPSTQELDCPVSECVTTSDRSLLPNSSAVLLHWRNVNASDLPPECNPSPTVRCPPWVLFNKEAPPHVSRDILEALDGKVHLVASYRRDSDLFAPYGKISPRSSGYSKPVYDPKKRLVCWLVSNCNTPSNREELVSALEDYIEVDTYGQCGHMKCQYPEVRDCYRWLSERCLFYLSLENSLCKDYTTEKLYYALENNMVPVILGNGSSNYLHLPQRSYINAADFSSIKELADYLVTVGKDKKLFLSYLRWKRVYEAEDYSYKWFCDLCAMLHGTKAGNFTPRENLVSWWFEQSNCVSWRRYKYQHFV